MRSFKEACQFGGGKQSDVARSTSPDNHRILLIDHLVENAGQILTQTRICCFPGHHAPQFVLYSIPVRVRRSQRLTSTRPFSRPRACSVLCRLLGSNPSLALSWGVRRCNSTQLDIARIDPGFVLDEWAFSHKKNCYLTAHFWRRASRCGAKKAIVATAHEILIIAFHILRDGTEYQERGGDYFDRLNPERTQRKLTARLERLGWQVVLTPRESPPEAAVPPRKRGRPCKCAERAIDCKHKGK